ncbi:hypothetical protein ACIBG8_14380 [Nonomuraea sp. NPDC050556]|uniref:hypothetical protein n=1 Tax=Nonomuraea sp. NPDC050556 TaxID=3364369 RepID=UPI0037AD232A
MRLFKIIVVVLVALGAVGVGGVALAYPSVAAATCPGCYGLESIGDGVYAEGRRADVLRVVAAARARVKAFYGELRSSPRLLVCVTEKCYSRLGGGGEKGVAVLNRAVMLSPRGLDPVIAAHELSHVEFHARLVKEAPQWVDEGLAVVVSQDSRYLPAPATCPAGPPLPETLDAWLASPAYARAACEVTHRLDALVKEYTGVLR